MAVEWEKKIGPTSVLAVIQLFVLICVTVAYFVNADSDAKVASTAIGKLETIVQQQATANSAMLERFVKVETKVEVMGSTLSRIESRQINPSVTPQ